MVPAIEELDIVALLKPFHGLPPGALGVVVCVWGKGVACEVEFFDGDGMTLAVETLDGGDVALLVPMSRRSCFDALVQPGDSRPPRFFF